MNYMPFGLKDSTIRKIHSILSSYPQVESAILYGSRAKGTYKNGSDIDLTLSGSASLTMDVLYKIMKDIDELLLAYTFDLSIFANIHDQNLLDHIRRVGVNFYTSDKTLS